MKTLLAVALAATLVLIAPFPSAQGACAPTAETFGVTAIGDHYFKHYAFIAPNTATRTPFVSDSIQLFAEDNGIPGLQTTSGEACGAMPDTDVAGLTEGVGTGYFTFYACTVGTVTYCPVTG